MCGRYYMNDDGSEKLRAILEELNRRDALQGAKVHMGEIFPSQLAPVLVAKEGACTVRAMNWGFPRGGGHGLVINSRSEKADETPMFQKAVRERRCLVPMSGFYEWRRTPSGGKTKEKFAFTLAEGKQGELMYLAGVYGEFVGGFAGGGFDGFAILTREADEQMAPYHNRMPVILREEGLKKAWLFSQFPYAELRRQFAVPQLDCKAVAALEL
ncbi:MAG: SOS response-associated peptidase family protein [Clostridia bacterium]